ncbi:MAG: hypothetical protein ACP5VP_07060 [Candidatus Limnocylindrales bacterium]
MRGDRLTTLGLRIGIPGLLALVWLAYPGFGATAWLTTVAFGALAIAGRRMSARPLLGAGVAARCPTPTESRFSLAWVAWGALAGAAGFVAALVTGGVAFIIYGLVVALPQWYLLRRRLAGAGWWLVVTAAIWPIAALTGLEFLYLAGPLGPLAGGFLLGAAQWIVLAGANRTPRAWTWIPWSSLAWACDAWTVMVLAAAVLPAQLAGLPASEIAWRAAAVGAAGGLAYAIPSTLALARLTAPGASGARPSAAEGTDSRTGRDSTE